MKYFFINIPLLILLASPAQATEPQADIQFKGMYEFGLTGIDIGRMGIEIEQDANHYAIAADIMLVGLAKMIANHSSHTVVDASGGAFYYPNRQYETHYRTKKKQKSVLLEYKAGKLIKRDVQPPDNSRTDVSTERKDKAYDPLSFILQMREKLMAILLPDSLPKENGKMFTLNAYDGRRLTEATFTLLGRKNVTLNGKRVGTYAMSVKRKPIEGFTAKEIDDWSPKEPPLIVYFSDDARMIPLKLELNMWYGTLTANLAKECRTGESCLLGIKE